MNLKQLYLTLINSNNRTAATRDFLVIIDIVKQFSSSLICLSMNLIDSNIHQEYQLPFNGIELQKQLLEAMTQLKQFHLYAKLAEEPIDVARILSTFENEFWFNHNWSVGMHGKYLYTLPFHFNELNEFIGFDHVQSANSDIQNCSWMWYKVISIELVKPNRFDINLINQIRIKMPKLISIKVNKDNDYFHNSLQHLKEYETNNIDSTLNNVTTIHISGWSIDNIQERLTNPLPNLKNLILNCKQLHYASINLVPIWYKKIERLYIQPKFYLSQLVVREHIYFSNVQQIQIIASKDSSLEKFSIDNYYVKILRQFKNLNTLTIDIDNDNYKRIIDSVGNRWTKMITTLPSDDILNTYKLRSLNRYIQFLRN